MINAFKKIFQLTIQHDYFNQSNATSVVRFGPHILNGSHGAGLRDMKNGSFVFMPVPKTDDNKASLLALGIPLQFTADNFLNYTDITFTPSQITYFELEQASDGIIYSSQALSLPVHPSRFTYPLAASEMSDLQTIQLENPIGSSRTLPLPSPPYQEGYAINLTGELAGKYQLRFNFEDSSKNISQTIFVSDQLSNNLASAVFEWRGLPDFTEEKTPNYTLSFKARATYWRYLFIGFNEEEWKEARISSVTIDGESVSFQKTAEAVPLANGTMAFEALSSAPIPLRERPEWKIQLQSKRLQGAMPLPYAQPNTLRILDTENGITKYCSDIYIYL